MSTVTERYTLVFPEHYDARSEYETPSRGYLSEVVVQFADGNRYALFFVDPTRLQQELANQVASGSPLFAEPNMIVLPQVSTPAMRQAVEMLVQEGYFTLIKPL